MRRRRLVLEVGVALGLAVWGCAGTTTYEDPRDAGALDAPGGNGIDVAQESAPGIDAEGDEPAACEKVGKGPGIEICCEGQLCRGKCYGPTRWDPGWKCRCDGAFCPPTGACCYIANPATGTPGFGPFCVAPADCVELPPP